MSAAPTPARANTTQGDTGDQDVDGLLSGTKWTGTLSYSFPNRSSDYSDFYGWGESSRGFSAVSAAQKTAVHESMRSIEAFTTLDVEFLSGAEDRDADIRIASSSEANPTAYAYYPGVNEGGDIWFGNDYNYRNPELGDYSYLTVLHEVGHSLGLKHSHESGGVDGAVPRAHDALEFTVMAYRSYVNAGLDGGYTNERFGYPQSYMMNDIAALQAMYGADFNVQSGDSTYSFDRRTGEMFIDGAGQGAPGANRVFLTIWDGNGEDTYDFSSYTNAVTIDLRPGRHSVTSNEQKAYLGDGHDARGNVYNAYQFENDASSLIENAIGGRGNDRLIGNAGNNILDGGLGADSMSGGAGNDLYRVNNTGDRVIDQAGGTGIDRVVSTISFNLSSAAVSGAVENLALQGRNDINATGNALNNVLTGNSGDNHLKGLDGNDRLDGRAGNDTLTGGDGADTFILGVNFGVDVITDYNPGEDAIRMDASLAADFADLLTYANDVGGDAVITFGGDEVRFKATTVAELEQTNFLFV